MKIYKALPILLVSTLLAGCNLFQKQENKAKKYSNESTEEVAYDKYDKSMNSFAGDDSSDDDLKIVDSSISELSDEIISPNGTTLQKYDVSTNNKFNIYYDADNLMGRVVSDTSSSAKMNYFGGQNSINMKVNATGDFYAKETKVSDTEYKTDIINVDSKNYYSSTLPTSMFFLQFSAAFSTKTNFSLSIMDPASYALLTEEVKAHYKFYVDDNIITMTCTGSETVEDSEYTLVEEFNITTQFVFEDEKISAYYNLENTTTYTYKEDSYYGAGVKNVQKRNMYHKSVATHEKVDLNLDYSSYTTASYYNFNSMYANSDIG